MFSHYLCEITEAHTSPEACAACARVRRFPECPLVFPVVQALTENRRPDDFGPTATDLIGCLRQKRLKIEVPYAVKPTSQFALLRGNLFHSLLELKNTPEFLTEQRFSIPVETPHGTAVVSGQVDLFDPLTGTLYDFKSTKRVPQARRVYTCPTTGALLHEGGYLRKFVDCSCGVRHNPRDIEALYTPEPYGNHVAQLSLYRVILEEQGYEVKKGLVVYLDMEQFLPLEIPFMSPADTWRFVEARVATWLQPGLPAGVMDDPDQGWMCAYCPVRTECELRFSADALADAPTEAELLEALGF